MVSLGLSLIQSQVLHSCESAKNSQSGHFLDLLFFRLGPARGILAGMAQKCSVCAHPLRDDVDAAIVAGESYRDIARRFEGLSKSAGDRHALSHVPARLARAAAVAEDISAARLMGELRSLGETTREVLAEARSEGNHVAALSAIARLEKQVELVGRLAGELVERRVIEERTLLLDSRWIQIRSLLLEAMRPFPDALAAVRSVLSRPGGGGDVGA